MPDAARISDFHACPNVEPGPVPHVGGPIFSGSGNVIIGFLPAARVGDSVVCFPLGPTDSVEKGSTTVVINNRAAARRADACSHGSRIVAGCPTVIIGDSPQSFTLRAAAKRGIPFCEECERKRREMDDRDGSAAPAASTPPGPDTATLADEQPPPGAITARDPVSRIELGRSELASQANLCDGLDDVRAAARYSLAFHFYAAHGGARIKPSKIWSHIGAIDISRPVEVIDVSKTTLHQRGVPGAKDGEYFTLHPEVLPTQLGISDMVYAIKDRKPVPPPVSRDRRTIEFGKLPAKGLKSTAAPVTDTWSMPATANDPGEQVGCEGGGTQVMVPAVFHGSSTTTIQ